VKHEQAVALFVDTFAAVVVEEIRSGYPDLLTEPLSVVAESLDGAAIWAYVHGDVLQGDRLRLLASCVEREAAYEHHVARGYERVTRRPGKWLGWRLRNDPDLRARRRALGRSVL
jgi:hypothetical protein